MGSKESGMSTAIIITIGGLRTLAHATTQRGAIPLFGEIEEKLRGEGYDLDINRFDEPGFVFTCMGAPDIRVDFVSTDDPVMAEFNLAGIREM
jgi:hypothetical protein